MPPKLLQRVVVVICVIRWKPAANKRWLRACVPSGGWEQCVQTHGAHWEGGTQRDLHGCQFLHIAGDRQAAAVCFWTWRRRERRPKDSSHLCLPVGSVGGSRFCLFVSNADVSRPLSRDVLQPPLQNSRFQRLNVRIGYTWMYRYLLLLAIVCGPSNFSLLIFF